MKNRDIKCTGFKLCKNYAKFKIIFIKGIIFKKKDEYYVCEKCIKHISSTPNKIIELIFFDEE